MRTLRKFYEAKDKAARRDAVREGYDENTRGVGIDGPLLAILGTLADVELSPHDAEIVRLNFDKVWKASRVLQHLIHYAPTSECEPVSEEDRKLLERLDLEDLAEARDYESLCFDVLLGTPQRGKLRLEDCRDPARPFKRHK